MGLGAGVFSFFLSGSGLSRPSMKYDKINRNRNGVSPIFFIQEEQDEKGDF